MYNNRLKLVLLCVASGSFILLLNSFMDRKQIRSYSYLNVVQQSFNLNQNNAVETTEPDSEILADNILFGENKTCRPVKNIIFAKTHKTGSTTVQNIIYRFGEEHHLMFVLPKSGQHYFHLRQHFSQDQAELFRNYDGVR